MEGIYGKFTALAFQFGPFFFAILFILIVTRQAWKWYTGATTKEEREIQKRYFQISYSFGILLVACSVGWWIYAQLDTRHGFEGIVVSLADAEVLYPVANGSVIGSYEPPPGSPRGLKNYRFAILSREPVQPGTMIRLNYLSSTSGVGSAPSPKLIELPVSQTKSSPQCFELDSERKSARSFECLSYHE